MGQEILEKIAEFFINYPLSTFDKQQILIRAREIPSDIFYILEGRVSQYDIAPGGNEVVVNVFKPGAFFPMSSAINNTPNAYFFEASIKTIVRRAPVDATVAFLKNNSDVTFDLLSRVYKGTDGILRRMAHLMGGGAESRLLFELLNAANRFGEQQPDGSVSVALSEVDLAKHSGLARETVSRCVQSLKATGLVEITQGRIIIKDAHKLEAILGAGP